MNGYIVRLDQLGFGMDNELNIDLILDGLPDSFAQFVFNYRMDDKETSIPVLINLIKTVTPQNIPLQFSTCLGYFVSVI